MASTIDQILAVLKQKQSEKKQALDEEFESNTKWLQNELDLIKQLIKQNVHDEERVQSIQTVFQERSAETGAQISKKRKSPEVSLQAVKLSPEQKKLSLDIDQIVSEAGLPSDLNKLKKEQLLEELEKRGNSAFTMKALKKDLIDALKDAIMVEHRSLMSQASNVLSEIPPLSKKEVDSNEVPLPPPPSAPTTTPGKSRPFPRQGSMMNEFRRLVVQPSAETASAAGPQETAAAETKARIENEFRNRQERHRESIARKSLQSISLHSTGSSQQDATEESSVPVADIPAAAGCGASASIDEAEELHHDNIEQAEVAKKEEESSEDEEEQGEESQTMMDVCSPVQPSRQEQTERKDEEIEPEVEEVEAIVDVEHKSNDISESIKDHQSSTATYTAAPVTNIAIVKKPTNLMNLGAGQASFLDKQQPPVKTAVAALEKAKQAKAAEEQRALQKKKDQEARQQAIAANKASQQQIQPTASSTSSKTTMASEASTAKGMTSPWDKLKKGVSKKVNNLFGKKDGVIVAGASNKEKETKFAAVAPVEKPVAIVPVALPAPTNIVHHEPVAVVSTSGKTSFDVNAVEAKQTAIVEPVKAVPAPVSVAILPSASVSSPPKPQSQQQQSVPILPSKATISQIRENYIAALAGSSPAPTSSTAMVVSPPAKVSPVSSNKDRMEHALKEIPVTAAPLPVVANQQQHVQHDMEVEPTANEYQIEDRESSDSDSGTDDEEEKQKNKQTVPDWARGDKLREALERQYGLNGHTPMDPDSIFYEVVSCSLEEIFGQREGLTRKYHNRTSSAHWDADELTIVEKRQYRMHMGYETPVKGGAVAAVGGGASSRPTSLKMH